MSKRKRVVITGTGVLSPIGNNTTEFLKSLKNGSNGIKPISLFDTSDFSVNIAGELGIDFEDFFEKLVSKEGSTWQTIERRLEKDFKDNEEALSKHINSIWFDLSRDPLNGSNYESLNALAKTSNQIKTDLSKLGNAQKQQADVYLENLLNFSVMNLITQVSLLNYNTFFIFHSITKSLK